MPIGLVIIGLLMIVTGVKGTQAEFGAQVIGDFTGPGNFIYWLASLGAVGALGYVPAFRKFSIAFMTLIIVAMLIANKGFFAQLQTALQTGPVSPATAKDGTGAGASGLGNLPHISQLPTPAASNDNAAAHFGQVIGAAEHIIPFFL